MPASQFTEAQATVPQFGLIVGGLFDGWSFSFVRAGERPDGSFFLDIRAKPERWPFPKLIRIGKGDYLSLTAGVERDTAATTYELQKLLNDAALAAGKKK
ncbi:hypothetical protein D9M73_68960 [compost metagenome]